MFCFECSWRGGCWGGLALKHVEQGHIDEPGMVGGFLLGVFRDGEWYGMGVIGRSVRGLDLVLKV